MLELILGLTGGIVLGVAFHMAWLERPGRAVQAKARRIRTGFACYRESMRAPFDISPPVDEAELPVVDTAPEVEPATVEALVRTSGAHAAIDPDADPDADEIYVGIVTVEALREISGAHAAVGLDEDQADTGIVVNSPSRLRHPGYLDANTNHASAADDVWTADRIHQLVCPDDDVPVQASHQPFFVVPQFGEMPLLFDALPVPREALDVDGFTGSYRALQPDVDVSVPFKFESPVIPDDVELLPIVPADADASDDTPAAKATAPLAAVIPAPRTGRQWAASGSKRKGGKR